MLEILASIVGELSLQAVVEALFELGLHSVAETFEKRPKPWLAALGYAIFGAILGGLSLLVLREHLVPGPWRVVNVLVTPVVAGLLMMGIGAWRRRRGQETLRIDRFAYGYLFALALALTRFVFAS